MKKASRLSAVILAAAMIFTPVILASCEGTEDTASQITSTYNEFGNAFYNAVKCCAFNDCYESEDFKQWSALLKEARSVKKNADDYPESDLEAYIASWKTAIEELNALAAQHPLPSDLADETEETVIAEEQ